jgi:hypothetical protein
MGSRYIAFAAMTLAVAPAMTGCGKGDDDPRAVAPSGFVPPVTQAPAPVAGQANTVPLTAYVGHHPRDAVDGVSFFDRTEVANALIEAVPEAELRHRIIGRDAGQRPIFADGPRIAVHGCDTARCDTRNWTVFVAADGDANTAAFCYHDARTMGEASRWTTRAGTGRRSGACPAA